MKRLKRYKRRKVCIQLSRDIELPVKKTEEPETEEHNFVAYVFDGERASNDPDDIRSPAQRRMEQILYFRDILQRMAIESSSIIIRRTDDPETEALREEIQPKRRRKVGKNAKNPVKKPARARNRKSK